MSMYHWRHSTRGSRLDPSTTNHAPGANRNGVSSGYVRFANVQRSKSGGKCRVRTTLPISCRCCIFGSYPVYRAPPLGHSTSGSSYNRVRLCGFLPCMEYFAAKRTNFEYAAEKAHCIPESRGEQSPNETATGSKRLFRL